MQTKQQTLAAPISFSGKGLHTGVTVNMTVNPAADNNGIVFRRIDLEGTPTVPALCEYVTDTSREARQETWPPANYLFFISTSLIYRNDQQVRQSIV